jgi:hypothetical protein
VPRFVHRRAIVFVVLLCQLLAVGVVHVPMAKAAQAPPVAAVSGHCHDSAPAPHSMPADPGHHCKTGFCACVCLNAPAALPETSAPEATVSHPPLLVTARACSAPERATAFFRPPI